MYVWTHLVPSSHAVSSHRPVLAGDEPHPGFQRLPSLLHRGAAPDLRAMCRPHLVPCAHWLDEGVRCISHLGAGSSISSIVFSEVDLGIILSCRAPGPSNPVRGADRSSAGARRSVISLFGRSGLPPQCITALVECPRHGWQSTMILGPIRPSVPVQRCPGQSSRTRMTTDTRRSLSQSSGDRGGAAPHSGPQYSLTLPRRCAALGIQVAHRPRHSLCTPSLSGRY